jgi:hypothetical protein
MVEKFIHGERRVKPGQALVALVVLVLAFGTLYQGYKRGEAERCAREASAARSDANAADWKAIDTLISGLATASAAHDQTFDLTGALQDYLKSRAENDTVRAENKVSACDS